MFYPGSAVERAMRIQEVVMREATGQIRWFQVALILGVSCRTLRRWCRKLGTPQISSSRDPLR